MLATAPPRTRLPFFYGWWIVFASAAIVFLSAGTFFYGFGLLVAPPLTAEFGWSRAAISVAFSLRTEVGGIAAPLVGFTVDRVGPRLLMIGGVIVVSVGFFLMSQVGSLWALYGAVMVIAIGMSATGGAMPSVVVSRWFKRQRGRALGFMTFGGGSAGIMAIVFAFLIDGVGWREALVITAVFQLLLATPLAFSIRNSPEEMGLQPDGDTAPDEASSLPHARPVQEGMTTREVLRSSAFWRFAFSLTLAQFASTSVVVHQVPFLTESAGMSDAAAAASVTAMTALSLVGRIGFGSAADFVPKNVVMATAYLAVAASLALLSTVHHAWQLVYVLPLFGLGFGGAIPVRSSLQAEFFGLRAFGAVQGLVLTVSTLGAFTGPVLTGWLYDVTGSYRLAFLLLAIPPLVAAPLVLSARRPRLQETAATA